MFDQKPASDEGTPLKPAFDFSAFPPDTLFHQRRDGRDRREDALRAREKDGSAPAVSRTPPERRAKKERRRRIDPTTFEKQYTDDELEFMNAMQRFKVQLCKTFPSYGEVLRVAISLGYRKAVLVAADHDDEYDCGPADPVD